MPTAACVKAAPSKTAWKFAVFACWPTAAMKPANPRHVCSSALPNDAGDSKRCNTQGIFALGAQLQGLLQKLKQAVAVQEAPKGPLACASKVGASMSHLVSLHLDPGPPQPPCRDERSDDAVASPLGLKPWHPTAVGVQANPWRAVNALPPASTSNKMTAYERALVSSRPASLPWQAKLKIRTEVLPGTGP
jgi:hypothetical protein